MSLYMADRRCHDEDRETHGEAWKQSKIPYTREYLLALGELDVCKRLPSGFDQSILSEFDDVIRNTQDRQRIPPGLPLQGIRQSNYSSSPPTRGDSGNFSRGGRWESRSSGHNDRDSDSQSDKDSDSGRRYSNQSRHSWQRSEHDGLLGSGSFPKPTGISAPKVRANDHYQLNRSNEAYHPPRPYKATPHSRREITDSINDETFGSAEHTSEDKVEEERRRRASFELMRKEQQKVLQEKQKLNLGKHKADSFSDISVLLDDAKEKHRPLYGSSELEVSPNIPGLNNDSGRSSQQNVAPRPLVPPGFANTILEKNSSSKSLLSSSVEAGKHETEDLHAKATQNVILDSSGRDFPEVVSFSAQQVEDKNMPMQFPIKGAEISNLPFSFDASGENLGVEVNQKSVSSLLEVHKGFDVPEITECNSKASDQNIIGETSQSSTASVLEKIFGSVLTMNTGESTGLVENHDNKVDGAWSPGTVKSSKFAQWFIEEEERKPTDEFSNERPSDLLALIIGGDKGRLQDSDRKAVGHFPREVTSQSSVRFDKLMPTSIESSKPVDNLNKQMAVPSILTCEDLEQTILSEFSEVNSTGQPDLQGSSPIDAETEHQQHYDNRASQHLLSLLHKEPHLTGSAHADIHLFGTTNLATPIDQPKEEETEKTQTSGKTLTLETLFGTSFMKELQSYEAPVSTHRGPLEVEETDLSVPNTLISSAYDKDLSPSTTSETKNNRTSHKDNILAPNRDQSRLGKSKNWLGDLNIDSNSLKHPEPKDGGFDGAVEFWLPEEESLFTVGDRVNSQFPMMTSAGNLSRSELSSPNALVNISDKLIAMSSAIKDERYSTKPDPSFLLGPFDQMSAEVPHHSPFDHMSAEVPYHNLHPDLASPQLHSLQMNHLRPMFHPLDSHPHVNSQVRFMGPKRMIGHQVPTNAFRPPLHHLNPGVDGFDHPAHHPMLQQTQISGNHLPHLTHDLLRGDALPHHGNQAGAVQELNRIEGFSFRPHQPNIGGLAMPAPGIDHGSNHPEALRRLFEMELRVNPKQIQPFPVGHNQGMFSHELNTGLPYR